MSTAALPVRRAARVSGWLGGASLVLVALVGVSLLVGSKAIPVGTVVDALTAFDPTDNDHLFVREERLPRTLLGLLVAYQVFLGEEVLLFLVLASGTFVLAYAVADREAARPERPAELRQEADVGHRRQHKTDARVGGPDGLDHDPVVGQGPG